MTDRKDGFTPVFDDVAQKVGLNVAVVFGCVWRHCQMRHGTCHASLETMSGLLNVSKRTVQKHLDTLENRGFIYKASQATWYIPPTYICIYEPSVTRVEEIAILSAGG